MPSVLLPPARGAAVRGALRLLDKLNAKGKFQYQWHAAGGSVAANKYNLLRHYGAVWSILTTFERCPEISPGVYLNQVITALQWARKKYVRMQCNPPPGDQLHIWEFVVWHDHIKLGANGLALLAVSQLIRCLLKFEYDANMSVFRVSRHLWLVTHAEQLAFGLHHLRHPDGSFIHKANITTMQPTDFVSEYYVGEALFALAHWRQTCEVMNASINKEELQISPLTFGSYVAFPEIWHIMEQLAANNYGVAFQSHWMLYAVAHEICQSRFTDLLLPYMRNLVRDIIDRAAYRRRRESTPIACRSEGLLAALAAYRKLNIEAELQQEILRDVEVNIMLQLQWVKPKGDVVQGDKSGVVRIDFIQHSISAFASYWQLLGE